MPNSNCQQRGSPEACKLWDHQREKKERTFLPKALTCILAQSQNRGLSEYQRRASWLHTGPSPLPCPLLHAPSPSPPEEERQTGDSQSWKSRGCCCNLSPRQASTKLWPGSQLLTTSSWDPGWWTSTRRGAAWDQLPRGDTPHTWDGALKASQETEQPGPRRWLRCTAHLGQCACQAPLLSCSDLGRAQNALQTSLCPCGVPKNLSSLNLGSSQNARPTLDSTPAEHPGGWAV